jgi:hypothetical protein
MAVNSFKVQTPVNLRKPVSSAVFETDYSDRTTLSLLEYSDYRAILEIMSKSTLKTILFLTSFKTILMFLGDT